MFFGLKQPWCLRGYQKDLMLLEKSGELDLPYRLTFPLFDLLNKCDGVTDIEIEEGSRQEQVIKKYMEMGVLEKTDGPKEIETWQRYKHFDNRRIPRGFFSVTGRCNLNCIHCFSATEYGKVPFEFSMEQIEHILDQYNDCGIRRLTISGGEPLLRSDFTDIIKAMADRNMEMFRLYTNGMFLDERIVNSLKENSLNPQIVISFDGVGTHDWIRNYKGAQKKAEESIAFALDSGFEVKANVNVNSKTAERLPETAHYLYDLGIRSIFFIRTSEGPKWIRSGYGSLSAEDYWTVMLEVMSSIRQENKKDLEIVWFNGPTLTKGITAEALKSGSPYRYESEDIKNSAWCFKAINDLYVSSTGMVFPCDGCEGVALQTGWLGEDSNILKRPLRDIINDSHYSEIMRMTAEEVIEHSKDCKGCDWEERCHGGNCRVCGMLYKAVANGYTFENCDIDIKLPAPLTCTFYKKGYYEKLLKILEE